MSAIERRRRERQTARRRRARKLRRCLRQGHRPPVRVFELVGECPRCGAAVRLVGPVLSPAMAHERLRERIADLL